MGLVSVDSKVAVAEGYFYNGLESEIPRNRNSKKDESPLNLKSNGLLGVDCNS